MNRRPKRQNVPTEFHAATEAEALFLEQAQAYFRDIQNVAGNAPYGKTLDQTETAVLLNGRKLVRQSLELAMQERVDELEKKKKPRSAKPAKRKNGTGDTETKTS